MSERPEEPEGIETSIISAGWGEYPLDSVFVRREERTAGEVVKRINNGRYLLDPDFQRSFVWGEDKQSKLIESCIMRIPLPVVYVAEAKDGKIIVVDGLQRLETLRRFLNNEFELNLGDIEEDKPHPLNDTTFADLSIQLQERIEDTPLIFYILDPKAPERARLDIFDRVNSGMPLSRQQMRNALYNGRATRWLAKASDSDEFLQATGKALERKNMRDREVINRFCAFSLLDFNDYVHDDMDGFLGRGLEFMNAMTQTERNNLRGSFLHSMVINYEIFGSHAFRKSLVDNDPSKKRSPINVALFDVCSVILADLPDSPTKAQKKEVGDSIRDLLRNEEFFEAISYATNSTKHVHDRFRLAYKALEEVI